DGRPAPESGFGGRLYVEALRGRGFSLRLRNPTGERVAVALSVDGRNVIDAKRTTAGRASKWVLSPGETADIPGWQVSGETSRRFFFTGLSRSYARWLGGTSNTRGIGAVFFPGTGRQPPRDHSPGGSERQLPGLPKRAGPRRRGGRGWRPGRGAGASDGGSVRTREDAGGVGPSKGRGEALSSSRRRARGDGHRRADGFPRPL